jgi:fatty acid desaturase
MLQRPRKRLAQDFSLAEARSLIADLFTPNPTYYWTDFLLSIFAGHLFAALVRGLPFLIAEPLLAVRILQGLCFVASALLYYRASLFIHELVHLPQAKFRGFRIAWNLLCGIPFLIPSFVYYTHIDHHRRKHFGTEHDGEYMPLGLRGWGYLAYYLALCPLIPAVAVFRFLVLTPLTWLHPAIRRWVHRRASSMVMDPTYLRPLPTAETLRTIRWQEIACFFMCLSVPIVALGIFHRWPIPFLIQAYCTGTFIVTLNAIRTIGAHRWWNDGEELTFVDQMLDSVTVANRPWISELWGPIGTRFHSLHHLFPSLPYHNMPAAHRRLMAELPANSPYRLTVEPSLTAAVTGLLRRSWRAGYVAARRQARQSSLAAQGAAR